MVGVFVSDQNGIEAANFRADSREARQGFALSESGINEDAGAFGFEQGEVARAAGRKDRDAQTDGNCPLVEPRVKNANPLQPLNRENNGRAHWQRQ